MNTTIQGIDRAALIGDRQPAAVYKAFFDVCSEHISSEELKTALELAIKEVDKQKPPVFELNGKEVDLRNVIPLTVKDWKELKKLGVDVIKLSSGQVELDDLTALVEYLVKKANPDLGAADVESLPGTYFMRIAEVVNELGAQVDVPF